MKKVVGVGSLNVDITCYTPHLPVDGETVMGRELQFGPGGKGNNQMTAAQKAGATAVMIGKLGNDPLSSTMREHIASVGMPDRCIDTIDGQTGSAVIEVSDTNAQNRIIVIPGANGKVSAADVSKYESEFADADVALTQLETTDEAVVECKRLAQKYGIPFILNPAPFKLLADELLDGIDYITPNETEAEALTGVSVEGEEGYKIAAKALLAKGVKNAIITLGKRGAYFTDGTIECVVPSLKVKAVDTTGAGDAFNGGFAAALADGKDAVKALRYATVVAALAVSKYGAAAAMPSLEEILAFYKQSYNEEY